MGMRVSHRRASTGVLQSDILQSFSLHLNRTNKLAMLHKFDRITKTRLALGA